MSRINQKNIKKRDKTSHLNYMGGNSWDINNPIARLKVAASSCFFGEPMYYQDSSDREKSVKRANNKSLSDSQLNYLRESLNAIDPQEWRSMTPQELLVKAIDEAIDYDIVATLTLACILRNDYFIRVTPQIIMVRAANHKKGKGGIINKFAHNIIKRTDEPSIQLAYQIAEYGKPVPNSLKKAWKKFLEKQDEYSIAKYQMKSRDVKTIDVVRFCHANSESINKLMKSELKQFNTWENEISVKGSNQETWLSVLPKMGHMALLRNIRNFLKNEVDYNKFIPKLLATVEKGKQLPFRYYSAYQANQSAPANVLDAISDCLDQSLINVPEFKGKTIALCDNSGSAHGTFTSAFGSVKVSEIANLTALIAASRSDEGYIGVFGDNLEVISVSKRVPLLNQLEKANSIGTGIGQDTEHGIWLFFDHAIKNKVHYDNIFIFSDMQAGHGGLYGTGGYENYIWSDNNHYSTRYIDVAKLIMKYRQTVNKNVFVFLVQVAGYQDTLIPEYYDKTFILGGWSAGLFNFAKKMIDMPSQ